MFNKILYHLCHLLSTSYNKINSVSPNISSYLNSNIVDEIYYKKLFDFHWQKKFNYTIDKIAFKYKYDILDQNFRFTKIKLILKKSFSIDIYSNNFISTCINEYIIIAENLNNNIKIQLILEKEDDPILYNNILTENFKNINDLNILNYKKLDFNNLAYINSLYEDFMDIPSNIQSNRRNSNFNIAAACDYAQKYALSPNPDYKYFEGQQWDCTNFVSQIIYSGGISTTQIWKPYTNPWIRVEDLYSYLISSNIGYEPPSAHQLSKGCVIQFFIPKSGRFSHTGFVTYELKNGDYLYCCHSYNKLNYPLSAIYPVKYPQIRTIKLY